MNAKAHAPVKAHGLAAGLGWLGGGLHHFSFVFELGGGAFGGANVITRSEINRLVNGA